MMNGVIYRTKFSLCLKSDLNRAKTKFLMKYENPFYRAVSVIILMNKFCQEHMFHKFILINSY